MTDHSPKTPHTYWAQIPLLRDVDIEFIAHLLEQCLERELADGATIVVGDDTPTTFYLVLEGELSDDTGKRYGFGASLGDENLLFGNKRSYQLQAETKVRLLAMTEDDFWRMASLDPQLARNLAHGKVKMPLPTLPKRLRLWIGAAAAAVLTLSLGIFTYNYYQSPSTDQELSADGDNDPLLLPDNADNRPSYTVVNQPISEWLHLNGSVQPVRWTDITAPFDAVVKAVHYRFGDAVEKDQLLCELGTDSLQVNLRKAQTQTIDAQSEVEKLKGWESGMEVMRAKRDLASAREALKKTRREAENSQRLYDKGIVSRQELDTTTAAISDRENAVIAAEESLNNVIKQGDEAKLYMAQLRLKNTEYQQSEIEKQIASANIVSPTTGIIFPSKQSSALKKDAKSTAVNTGTAVGRNQMLFTIADMVGIAVETEVSENDVLKLEIEQNAKVTIDALPGIVLDGAIDQISGRGTVDQRKGTTFKVRVVVAQLDDAQREQIRIGMSADAKIKIYDNPSALVIPFEALQIDGNDTFVMLQGGNGKIERKQITVHTTLVEGVEVAQGLAAGDKVILLGGRVGEN